MQVGIIGGGQLAMMLCEAAKNLNIKTIVLDPNPKCSASFVCDRLITARYDSLKDLDKLASLCNVVTYEFENVDIAGIEKINHKYQNVVQTTLPLKMSNDRLIEKDMARESGFNPVQYAKVDSISDVALFVSNNDFPVVIKSRRFGYDGKGQIVIRCVEEIDNPKVQALISNGAICEKLIDLDYETSVIAVRNKESECKFIPSTFNTHKNNILDTTITIDRQLDKRIIELVTEYLNYHNLIGIITVEVFVDKGGNIYFNEMAPRPHNSGHYSIEGCNHSQFEMHIRCICGLELPDVKLLDQTMMVNILGQDYEHAKDYFTANPHPNLYFHDYYKQEPLVNRKMAHVTAVGHVAIEVLKRYQLIRR